jgi:23S rRNA (cytosine1962-C5)-methyltransferase
MNGPVMAHQLSHSLPACVLHEDEHLLVVNKPAGWNTHAPSPYAGEGIYDWLKHREPRWASLAIIHRLDKQTSGVMVFGKTSLAHRSLTEQFAQRRVRKKYLLLTDRLVRSREFTIKSSLVRAGEKYLSRPLHVGGELAETRFRIPASTNQESGGNLQPVEAEPLTGRTHQIRVHAAESGFPILGDSLYGGTAFPRLCLHATELTLRHPVTGKEVTFRTPADFEADLRLALRSAFIQPDATSAFRVIHGNSDGWVGWYVDRLGDFLHSHSSQLLTPERRSELERLAGIYTAKGVYHRILNRQARRASTNNVSSQLMFGAAAQERFTIQENGVNFELSFDAGYSIGLFLDQRDNRRRFLTSHVAADFPLFDSRPTTQSSRPEVLNTFAYTCGFSVCAALAGARTTSLDLSKKYLEWGKGNFVLNGLAPAEHDFIYGDAFAWLRRLAKHERVFDVVVLDPPTFSQSKKNGMFRAEKDYGTLVAAAMPALKEGGVLFASTNAAGLEPGNWLAGVERTVRAARRRILQRHYAPQPPDFPVSRSEPAYLKTVWMRIG